jgi:NADH-quinone oxidoreductase subunit N
VLSTVFTETVFLKENFILLPILANSIKLMLPELFLVTSLLSLVIYGPVLANTSRYNFPLLNRGLSWLSILILFLTFVLLLNNPFVTIPNSTIIFSGSFISDNLSNYGKCAILLGTISCLLISQEFVDNLRLNFFEYHLLILSAVLGLLLLVSSNDLISAYLAIEMQSLSFYVLAAFKRNSAFSTEAGLKYFILGAFSSGLILFGSTYIYGVTGSVNFEDISLILAGLEEGSASNSLEILKVFILFIGVGLLFKLAAAPFHMWSPDVYEGAPTSTSALFAIVPKIAVFILFFRLFHHSFYNLIESWQIILGFCAACSVIVGSFVALQQRKLKRLIAYSAISHVGYLLIAFIPGTLEASQSLFFYLFIYMITGVAIWTLVLNMELHGKNEKTLADLSALMRANGGLAITFSLIIFSLAGVPPLAGFYAKMHIFLAAMQSSLYFLSIVAVLSSVISTFYYIRLIKILQFEKTPRWVFLNFSSQPASLVLGCSFFLIIGLFFEPHLLAHIAAKMVYL